MKYPERFALIDRVCDGHRSTVQYDPTENVYRLTNPDGRTCPYTEKGIDALIDAYYDIELEKTVPQFPDQFSFFHAGTTQQYDMTKLHNSVVPLWACTRPDMAYATGRKAETGATYTSEEIAKHFDAGDWTECSFSEPQEPALNFPFTVTGTVGEPHDYEITDLGNGYAQMRGLESGYTYERSYEQCRGWITDGQWLVKSVGPQGAPEAPVGPSNDLAALSIKIDSDDVVEASERLERLAQAIESVNISLESFQAIFADVQDMLGNGRQAGCVTFCCGDE